MLPDTQFSGSFAGDLKDWFEALVRLGRFSDATYVNIGNAGYVYFGPPPCDFKGSKATNDLTWRRSEIFWGDSVLKASLGVQINLS